MVSLDEAKKKAAVTYNAAADYFDHPANSFWERFGRRTVERLHAKPDPISTKASIHGIEFARLKVCGRYLPVLGLTLWKLLGDQSKPTFCIQ